MTNTKKFLITTVIALLISSVTIAQNSDAFTVTQLNMESSSSKIEVTPKGDTIMVAYFEGNDYLNNSTRSAAKKYIGTPFYKNGWLKGTSSMQGDDNSVGMMAFDMVKNSIMFSADNFSTPIELKPQKFIFNGEVFRLLKYELPKAGDFYYNEIQTEEPRLVRQYSGSYIPIKESQEKAYTNTKENEYEGKFVKKVEYYLVVDSELILVSHKKSFLKSLGKYSEKAQKIVDQQKLDLKEPADIVKFAAGLKE